MNFEKCKKHELIAHAQKLGISNINKRLTKKQMIELLQQHGGIFKLPVSAPSNGKPTKPPSHHHNMTSIAIATGVKMMKDDVNSIIAKNVISNKKVVPRIINAMAASSDAVRNVKENSKRSP